MCTDAQCLCAISRRWQLGSSHGSCYLIATQGYSRSSTVLRERCMGRAAHKPGRATERARLTLDSGLASTKAHDRTTTQCRGSIERFFGASYCLEYDEMSRPQRDPTDRGRPSFYCLLERVRKEQRVESWRHGATAPRLLCKRVHLLVQGSAGERQSLGVAHVSCSCRA